MSWTRIQGFIVFLGLSAFLLPTVAIAEQGRTKNSKSPPKVQTVWVSDVDIISGGLDVVKATSAITKGLNKLERCYIKRQNAVSKHREFITFKVLVSEKGKVVSATVEETSIMDEKLMSCARNYAMDVLYPARSKGGYASLFYDIELDPRGNPQGGLGAIGLGNLNTIGHGSGVGSTTPTIRTGAASVQGSLTKEQIRASIRQNINHIRYCYERQLASHPSLTGRIAIRFVISSSGAVTSSSVASSTISNAQVEQCVTHAVQRIVFPQPQGGGVVIVTYPFLFQSAP